MYAWPFLLQLCIHIGSLPSNEWFVKCNKLLFAHLKNNGTLLPNSEWCFRLLLRDHLPMTGEKICFWWKRSTWGLCSIYHSSSGSGSRCFRYSRCHGLFHFVLACLALVLLRDYLVRVSILVQGNAVQRGYHTRKYACKTKISLHQMCRREEPTDGNVSQSLVSSPASWWCQNAVSSYHFLQKSFKKPLIVKVPKRQVCCFQLYKSKLKESM